MTSPWHIRVYNADFFTFAKDMLTTCANGPDVPGLPVGSANYGELIRWGTWVAVEREQGADPLLFGGAACVYEKPLSSK